MMDWIILLTASISSSAMPGSSTPWRLVTKIVPLPYFSATSAILAMLLALITPPGIRIRLAVSPLTLE